MESDVRSRDTSRARHTNLAGYPVTTFLGIYGTFPVADVAPLLKTESEAITVTRNVPCGTRRRYLLPPVSRSLSY